MPLTFDIPEIKYQVSKARKAFYSFIQSHAEQQRMYFVENLARAIAANNNILTYALL